MGGGRGSVLRGGELTEALGAGASDLSGAVGRDGLSADGGGGGIEGGLGAGAMGPGSRLAIGAGVPWSRDVEWNQLGTLGTVGIPGAGASAETGGSGAWLP